MPARREIVGYCLYDFANSSYTTLISTVAFAVYFSQVVVGYDNPRGDLLWGVASSMVHVLLIFTAPLLGAIADLSGRKKPFLLLATVQTVLACALLSTLGPGDVTAAILLFVIASVGYEAGYIFYNAFLGQVSPKAALGRISGLSWGIGFLGGLLTLALCSPFLTPLLDADRRLVESSVAGYRLSFGLTAAFFAVFSVPTFFLLRERRSPLARPGHGYLAIGFRRTVDTLRNLRQRGDAARFALVSLCYFAGLETVIKFSAIYAVVTFKMEGAELTRLFIVANVVAAPGTILAGYVADRIGPRRALGLTLLAWFLLLAGAAAIVSRSALFWLTPGIAIGVGSTQAIGRAVMAQLCPPDRPAEFFGFYLLCSRVGSILGLGIFAAVSWSTGSQRWALAAVAPLFLIGFALLRTVRLEHAARAPLA